MRDKVQCEATILDYANGRSYIQGWVVPKPRQCMRMAGTEVGPLHLCTTHARLTFEGFVDAAGRVEHRQSIRDCRNFMKGKLHNWAEKYKK